MYKSAIKCNKKHEIDLKLSNNGKLFHIITEKGYRSVRTKSILRPNFIFSIFQKGKLRENRLRKKFKSTIKDLLCLVCDL